MKSQITMKDMAQHFNVSLNTIHKAIYGKPGVSEATRKKIVSYAEKNGYRLNAMASMLKRKNMKIAVCLPKFNLEIQELAYEKGELSRTLEALCEKVKAGEELDGLLTVPPGDEKGICAVRYFTDKGLPVVFVTEDQDRCGHLGTVVGDYYAAGQLMAEQACRGRRILLMTGDPYKDSHYLVAKGFHEYMRQEKKEYAVEDLYGYYELDHLDKNVLDILKENPPDLICCVFSRGSAVLYRALKKSGMAGRIPVIASDVFDETVRALKEGTFTNLVFKDPCKQSYLAIKMLYEYLLMDKEPAEKVRRVEIVLIFKSNVNYFWENIKDMQYMRT